MTMQKKIKHYGWQEELLTIVTLTDKEVPLKEENKVLITIQLNSEEKIKAFIEWLKTKLVEGTLQTTETEIMNATARIGKLTATEATQ